MIAGILHLILTLAGSNRFPAHNARNEGGTAKKEFQPQMHADARR
jgi:hypothetical protein